MFAQLLTLVHEATFAISKTSNFRIITNTRVHKIVDVFIKRCGCIREPTKSTHTAQHNTTQEEQEKKLFK